MQLTLNLEIPKLPIPIKYSDKILLIGSCFTEHISERLSQHKFETLANPNGILFNPLSVASSLNNYVEAKQYREKDLFYMNEIWNSWDYHTRFSDIDKNKALEKINAAQINASDFIKDAKWIIITLGSAFQYYLKENNKGVANNHRAPANLFDKRLLEIDVIVNELCHAIQNILKVNPTANFIFTISPVRHIRDGIIENNRSKARLIEATHQICQQFQQVTYFPAYELLIDVLRDHRFYDIDLVHPNYAATQIVWERFVAAGMNEETVKIMEHVQDIMIARAHKTRFPETAAHQKFKESYCEKIKSICKQYPFLDFNSELEYFSS